MLFLIPIAAIAGGYLAKTIYETVTGNSVYNATVGTTSELLRDYGTASPVAGYAPGVPTGALNEGIDYITNQDVNDAQLAARNNWIQANNERIRTGFSNDPLARGLNYIGSVGNTFSGSDSSKSSNNEYVVLAALAIAGVWAIGGGNNNSSRRKRR